VSQTRDSLSGRSLEDSGPTEEAINEDPLLLQTCPPITNIEITDYLKDRGYIKAAIIEAQDNSKQPKYAMYLMVSWREGYCLWHVKWSDRPRLYKDLDRLLMFLRSEYGFWGAVSLRCANVVIPD
jgi:uncharacterized protein YbcV (DUF1398 family)